MTSGLFVEEGLKIACAMKDVNNTNDPFAGDEQVEHKMVWKALHGNSSHPL